MVLIDATNYVYTCITRQVTTIQIWVSLKHVLLCKYFGFTAPPAPPVTWPHVGYVLYGGALSSHQKGISFYQESIINDTGYDPLRQLIYNEGYLLIQIKIKCKKSVIMIMMLNVKHIYWHFLLAKVTLEMGKGSVAALLFFYLHGSWLKYRSIPLHTNESV